MSGGGREPPPFCFIQKKKCTIRWHSLPFHITTHIKKNFGFQLWHVVASQTKSDLGHVWVELLPKHDDSFSKWDIHLQAVLCLRRPICSKASYIFEPCWVSCLDQGETKVFFDVGWGLSCFILSCLVWPRCLDQPPTAKKTLDSNCDMLWQVRLSQTSVMFWLNKFQSTTTAQQSETFIFKRPCVSDDPSAASPLTSLRLVGWRSKAKQKPKFFLRGVGGLDKSWPSWLHVLMFMEDHLLQNKLWFSKSGYLGKSD